MSSVDFGRGSVIECEDSVIIYKNSVMNVEVEVRVY